MKKLVLVLVLVLAFTLPVFANPFVDVPLNHWAYDNVQSLAAKGVIVGYPDGTFGGQRLMTRYEFAEATAKALAYVEGMDFASAEDVAILEKLAIEFADELASLGVTVADLEAAVGANSEAIAALESTVAKHEQFFDQVVITGDITASYSKVVLPLAAGTLGDETDLTLTVTINDKTTAGVTIIATDVLSGAPAVTYDDFFIEYNGNNMRLRVGTDLIPNIIGLPDDIGLGLISHYDAAEAGECGTGLFNGFVAKWDWAERTDTNLGTWSMLGSIEEYYVLHVATTLGDKDDINLGVTASYDVLAGGFAGGADVAFNLGADNDIGVGLEVAAFYDTALSYAAAAQITGNIDDLGLTLKAYYVLPGFVPTMSNYTADILGAYVEAAYPFSDEVSGKLRFTYEMDSAMVAAVTTAVKGTLDYTPKDAAAGETAELTAEYSLITGDITGAVSYLNYPLADDFVLSGYGKVVYPALDYVAIATLEYAMADDLGLSVEGRIDSNGIGAIWSAEVELAYAVAENTTLKIGYEQNTWSDDIKDYDYISGCDLMTIQDTLGTLKASLEVTF